MEYVSQTMQEMLLFWEEHPIHTSNFQKKNLCSIIHNGATSLFWKDNWFKGCAPVDNWPLLFQLAQNKEEFIREITNRLSMISLEDFLVVSILANVVNAQSSL